VDARTCAATRYTGYDVDGGYAEYAVVPEDFAYALPEELDDEHVSPLLCAGLVGYRALQRATVPEKGRLLLVGFGSSAHIVIQVALHRGYEIWVVTRSENHIRQARELGAAWAGSDFRDVPGKADGAVLFAPSGKLVPPTLEALDRGGICSIAAIHLSDVPSLNYGRHLYQERELLSVTAEYARRPPRAPRRGRRGPRSAANDGLRFGRCESRPAGYEAQQHRGDACAGDCLMFVKRLALLRRLLAN
jgi:propanol-preferring alcohol dehydrogenase